MDSSFFSNLWMLTCQYQCIGKIKSIHTRPKYILFPLYPGSGGSSLILLFSQTWQTLTSVTTCALPSLNSRQHYCAYQNLLPLATICGCIQQRRSLVVIQGSGLWLLWVIHNIHIQINRKRLLMALCLPLHLVRASPCLCELLHQFNPIITWRRTPGFHRKAQPRTFCISSSSVYLSCSWYRPV